MDVGWVNAKSNIDEHDQHMIYKLGISQSDNEVIHPKVPTPSSRDNPAIKYTMSVHIVVYTN